MDLFELARALIDIDSVTGREQAVAELLESRLLALGGRVERMPVDGERFNLFAAWGEPVVVLSTHLDTVPPFIPSSEDAESIRGRGACDAKGAIAAMLSAIAGLLAEGARGFGALFVVGEETASDGARAANREPRGSRFLIGGEPTGNRLAVGSKGTLYLALEAEGRMAHSAYPELGESAIHRLLAALAGLGRVELPSSPLLGEATLNIGTLSGGRAANVVADRARAEVMLRTVGPAEETGRLRRELLAAVAEVPGVRAAEARETPAMVLGSLPGLATTVVKFTSDLPWLGAWGEPFLLGPGSIHLAHTAEERVGKAELVAAARLYHEMVLALQEKATTL